VDERPRRLAFAPVISIAAIRACARGAGSEFALACDLQFASREMTLLGGFEVGSGGAPAGGPALPPGRPRPGAGDPPRRRPPRRLARRTVRVGQPADRGHSASRRDRWHGRSAIALGPHSDHAREVHCRPGVVVRRGARRLRSLAGVSRTSAPPTAFVANATAARQAPWRRSDGGKQMRYAGAVAVRWPTEPGCPWDPCWRAFFA
jgi:hypothetical protein